MADDRLVRSTLLAEGTSDRALLQIIRLTLSAHVGPSVLIAEPQLADSYRLPLRVKKDRGAWIRSVVKEYPCDLLFIHRDANSAGRDKRLDEIADWTTAAALPADGAVATVPIVPVHETEAWLLLEEKAIREAALYRDGSTPLNLPGPAKLERSADPKSVLDDALRIASRLSGSRLRHFDLNKARDRIAVTDLARLRRLTAFVAFERDLSARCSTQGWSD